MSRTDVALVAGILGMETDDLTFHALWDIAYEKGIKVYWKINRIVMRHTPIRLVSPKAKMLQKPFLPQAFLSVEKYPSN